MESYGIGCVAQARKIEDRVVVLRVTTDTLSDHASSANRQYDLLQEGRFALARVLAILFDPTAFET
jgi:hypothetical protein